MFTDKCRISLSRADGRQRVYQRQGVHHANKSIQERVCHGGRGLWCGEASANRTDLVILEGAVIGLRYRDEMRS